MSTKKCIFCGAPADLLCDCHLGWERKRGQIEKECPQLLCAPSNRIPRKYRKVHTCDAPICSACAVSSGTLHINSRVFAFSDSIDYCPGHDFGTLRHEITGLQTEAMRSAWRAKALAQRRARFGHQDQIEMFGEAAR